MTDLLDQYRLVEQIAATPEGVRYRAARRDSAQPVEVLVLKSGDLDRSRRCHRRVKLAQLIHELSVRPVLSYEPKVETPFVVLPEVSGRTLREELGSCLPIELPRALAIVSQLATALVAAHRVGLSHGAVTPEHVRIVESGADKAPCCQICFVTTPPLNREDFAEDVRQLGELWFWLTGNDVPAEQATFRDAMKAADPLDRPKSDRVSRRLHDWLVSEAAVGGKTVVVTATESDEARSGEEENQSRDDDLSRDREGAVAGRSSAPLPDGRGSTPPALGRGSKVSTSGQSRQSPGLDPLLDRQQLGRFRLLKKLGEGGMGAVWKAEDPLDGRLVAIKVLRSELAKNETALKRFHREARMLAEVESPYIANLLELNEDGGLQFIVMEFVDGQDVLTCLNSRGRLSERDAVAMVADAARALREAHARGVVHRDLKPENMLLVSNPDDEQALPRVKLTDFGLAREILESEAQHVTSAGSLLGTPNYMSPEQCSGTAVVDARADVYSLGATLFHLLAGRPPFEANTVLGIIAKQVNEPASLIRTIVPELSEAIEQIVAKCLAKSRESRFQHAGELLEELERLQRGEPTSILAHPAWPLADAREVMSFDFVWELRNSPEKLWPHVSNTERLNRAIGLPFVDYTTTADEDGGSQRFGRFKKLGMNIGWQEHPFEWIEGRRMGVLREYKEGPFKWLTSVVELTPRAGGGTTLSHRIRMVPSNLIGRAAAQIEVGVKSRKSLDQVYRRIDAALSGELGVLGDPFEDVPALPADKQRKLDERLKRLIARGVEPFVVERFGEYLSSAPVQQLARIRPIALAQRLSVDERQMIAACLHGAREGLLSLAWDIICPLCRIPSQTQDSLKLLKEHGHCQACQSEFELDFANSIELVFRIASDIKDCETGMYCVGGPAHSPHVVAQVRLKPGERFSCDLNLGEGLYRVRGPQLSYVVEFRVRVGLGVSRWELDLSRGPTADTPRTVQAGAQVFVLTNDQGHELVARLERVASRTDALTAARAAATPLFRELFPGECLSGNQLIRVEQITLLLTRLDRAQQLYFELGDARAFERIHEHLQRLNDIVQREGGSLVKTLTEGIEAVFTEPLSAVRAGLAMRELGESDLSIAVHRGPAMVATLNEHLDYFGATVSTAEQLLATVSPSGSAAKLVVSNMIAMDEAVAETIAARHMAFLIEQQLSTTPPVWLHRVQPAKT
ncbi:MAG: protein kinase domain-containing protein [Planctomycetaceae bacterium]